MRSLVAVHLDGDLATETVAGHFGTSREHLSRTFHEYFGIAYQRSVLNLRIEVARHLFAEGAFFPSRHRPCQSHAEFKPLRQQASLLKRMPSAYVRDNIRFTTQPIEEPKRAEHLHQIFNMVDADHMVIRQRLSHWDFDEPTKLLRILEKAA